MPMPDDNERHYHQGRGGRPDRHQNEAQQEAKQDLHAFDPLQPRWAWHEKHAFPHVTM